MHCAHPLSYFTKDDHSEIAAACTYEALRDIALRILHRMPPGVSMVCGPISTGGLGSIEKNLIRFGRAIELLAGCNVNVFTQIPFEDALKRTRGDGLPYKNGLALLETFYYPIFSSGRVARLCFLPDWQSSFGTQWEHGCAEELNLTRAYFQENFESCALDAMLRTM